MKRKNLFVVLLATLLCLSVVFASNAAQPTAKEMVIAKIKNAKLPISSEFYQKAVTETNLEVTKFDGTMIDVIGDLTNTAVNLLIEEDVPNSVIKVQLNTDIKGQENSADIYLADDKLIFTKDILRLVKDLGINDPQIEQSLADSSRQYFYAQDSQFKNMWEQFELYQHQQIPEEYKEMLAFIVEAVPEKCFTISSGSVTIELDQQAFEETIINLAAKAKDEKERAADIIVGLTKYGQLPEGLSEQQMKEQIISAFDSITVPTEEQVSIISDFVTMNLTFEAPILPGGTTSYDFKLDIHAPQAEGSFNIYGTNSGKGENLKGDYKLIGDFSFDTIQFNFDAYGEYQYAGETYQSNTLINFDGKDTSSDQWLEVELKSDSTGKAKRNLVIKKPVLTEDNSIDINAYQPESTEAVDFAIVDDNPAAETGLSLIVNGEYISGDVPPVIKNGRTFVPLRTPAQALGCVVQWQQPDQIKISTGDTVILMQVDSSNYTVNGTAKQADAAPYLDNGTVMVPIRFIAQELGAQVQYTGSSVIISE